MGAQESGEQSFWADSQRRAAFGKIVYRQQIILAFDKLREHKIEPILIKGWSIERFYPPGKTRKTGDIDLCVAPEDYRKAQIILRQFGFSPDRIDLHKGFRYFDKLPWAELFDNSELIALEKTPIRVLRPEDSLRVVCVHWLNDGGAEREKLWDIYYLIANRPNDFDWSRCLEANGPKRRKWILCAIAAAHHYVNLPIDETPLAGEIETILPDWFLPALEKEWADGVKIVSLEKVLPERDWQSLREQLRKRLQPNPIGASIDLEAPFNNWPRFPYQFADIILRFTIHFGRNLKALKSFLPAAANQNK